MEMYGQMHVLHHKLKKAVGECIDSCVQFFTRQNYMCSKTTSWIFQMSHLRYSLAGLDGKVPPLSWRASTERTSWENMQRERGKESCEITTASGWKMPKVPKLLYLETQRSLSLIPELKCPQACHISALLAPNLWTMTTELSGFIKTDYWFLFKIKTHKWYLLC